MNWGDGLANHVIGLYYDGRGWGLIIIVGWLCAIVGFYRLLAHREYSRFLTIVFVYSGISCLLYFGFQWCLAFEDADKRVWAALPLVAFLPAFLLSGYLVYAYAEKVIKPDRRVSRSRSRISIRLAGAILSAIGLAIWYYGVLHPYEGRLLYVAVVASLCPMIFGLAFLITGRRWRDLDR